MNIKNLLIGFAVVLMGTVFLLPGSGLAENSVATQTELGVPVYPGSEVKRKDDLEDPNTGAHWYKYEYFSDDVADKVIAFYERHTGKKAFENQNTQIFTINAPDGVMINVFSPSYGIPQKIAGGEKVIKTWKTLITVMKVEK